MLSRDEQDRLARLESALYAQDPLFVAGLRAVRPRPPLEYRMVRRRRNAFAAATAILLFLMVATSGRPVLAAIVMLAAIVCAFAAVYPLPSQDDLSRRPPR